MSGPCAKTVVECHIHTRSGEIAYGRNDCDNPQDTCPRGPDDDYTLCRTVCRQPGHAEEMAIRDAQSRGLDLQDSWAKITGDIHHVCEHCHAAMMAAGVRRYVHPSAVE